MTRARVFAGVIALVVAIGLATVLLTGRGGGEPANPDAGPTARVTATVVKGETLRDVATVYGVVQADPAASDNLAAPRAVIVTRVLARTGQSVAGGQALMEVTSAPGADLAYRQAANAAAFARADLARVQRLFEEHLVATDQLGAAKKTLADATAALTAQHQQGGGLTPQTVAAPRASVVTSVLATGGDQVAQGALLLTLARQDSLIVKLGLEPSAGRFVIGQAVTIRPLAGGPPIASRLTMVGHATDQATRTLDAVAPLSGASLPIGAAVEADVVTGAHRGLAVPRAAVVFDETGAHVFALAGGKARRVFVTVGHDYGDQLEISGPIAAGVLVAVQGAYELQDGMLVKVAAP